jgi:hypothetical protein
VEITLALAGCLRKPSVLSTGGCLRKPSVQILFPLAIFLSTPRVLMLFHWGLLKETASENVIATANVIFTGGFLNISRHYKFFCLFSNKTEFYIY